MRHPDPRDGSGGELGLKSAQAVDDEGVVVGLGES